MTALHTSIYALHSPLPGKTEQLLYNGLYGAYDVITEDEQAILEAGQFDRLPAETLERLIRRGHLVTQSPEEECKNAKLISRAYWLLPYRKAMDIVILPTYNCNFRCEYCFERKRLEKGQKWLGHVMSPEVLEAVFTQLEALRQKGVKLQNAILYGGEPLLAANHELVGEMMRRFRELGAKLAIVSNGYDLDHFLDLLAEYPVEFIQITVDGLAEVHDSRRYLAGGQGSFERIMRNVELALKQGISIHMRTNVNRSNIDTCMELLDEYERRGFTQYSGFRPYFKATTPCYEEDPANAISDADMFENLRKHGFSLDKAVKLSNAYSMMAKQIHQAMDQSSYPSLRPAHCGAESTMLVIDPDGTLYSCWDVVSDEKQAIGFTDLESKRFYYNFDMPSWRNRTVDQMEDCRQCPYLMLCGGGCAIESQNTLGDKYRATCGSVKQVYEAVAAPICSAYYEKNGEKELSRSWYDLIRGLTEEERSFILTSTDSNKVYELLKKYMTAAGSIF